MEGICKPANIQTPFGEEEVWFPSASTAKGVYFPPTMVTEKKLHRSTPYNTLTFNVR